MEKITAHTALEINNITNYQMNEIIDFNIDIIRETIKKLYEKYIKNGGVMPSAIIFNMTMEELKDE